MSDTKTYAGGCLDDVDVDVDVATLKLTPFDGKSR